MTDNNTNNGVDSYNGIDNNDTLYYVQQFKGKIFKCISSKIRKNAQYINIFTYNFKSYHVAIGIDINLIDDYQKYKWKSPVLNVGPNIEIISFDYSHCKFILNENCLSFNRYKIIGNVSHIYYNHQVVGHPFQILIIQLVFPHLLQVIFE
jgi:hypothetical protein